jgi:hypothetical protein
MRRRVDVSAQAIRPGIAVGDGDGDGDGVVASEAFLASPRKDRR